MTLEELRKSRDESAAKVQAMFKRDDHQRLEPTETFDADERAKHLAHIDDCDAKIEALVSEEARRADVDKNPAVKEYADKHNVSVDEASGVALRKKQALAGYVLGGAMMAKDRALLNGVGEYAARNVVNLKDPNIGSWLPEDIRAEINRSSDGGVLVDDMLEGGMVVRLALIASIYDVASKFNVPTGNSIKVNTSNLAGEVGQFFSKPGKVVGNKNALDAYAADNPTAAQVQIDFDLLTSGILDADWEVMADSANDIVGWLRQTAQFRIDQATAFATTDGDAGVVGNASANNHGFTEDVTNEITLPNGVSAADGGPLTTLIRWEDFETARAAIDPLYHMNLRVFMNYNTLSSLKKLKDNEGRPLFVPSISADIGGRWGTILGMPIHLVQRLPNMTAGSNSIYVGDPSYYRVYEASGYTLFRVGATDVGNVSNRQDTFIAFKRYGGHLVDAGGAFVKIKQAAS